MAAMKPITERERLTIYRMPHGVRATYLMWRLGLEPRYSVARETYAKHRRYIREKTGIDIISALPRKFSSPVNGRATEATKKAAEPVKEKAAQKPPFLSMVKTLIK